MDTKNRILGFDISRAFAIFGMIVVNFHLALNASAGSGFLNEVAQFFYGKSAATFVVLAGIGVMLLSKKGHETNSASEKNKYRVILIKRAGFLLVVGLLNYYFWIGDILHYYAVFLSIAAIFLFVKPKHFVWLSVVSFLVFYILFSLFDYTKGWDFSLYNFTDKWTIEGILRTLFFNGTHPVFPWMMFFFFGMYLSSVNWNNIKIRNRYLLIASIIFIIFQIISALLSKYASNWFGYNFSPDEIRALFGTDSIPPMPIYMFTGISFAVIVICLSMYFSEIFERTKLPKIFSRIGQMSLTIYMAHTTLGLGFYIFAVRKLFTFDINKIHQAIFSVENDVNLMFLYVFIAYILLGIFAYYWKEKFKNGPLELLMRKFSDN